MRRQEPVLGIDSRRKTQFRHPPDDQRLVRRLLGIFGEKDDPTGIQGRIDVIVAAMNVEGVFGQGPGRDLHHHRRALAGCVVVLFETVNDALPRREIDRPLAGNGERYRAALCGVLSLRFDGQFRPAEDVQLALRERLLVHFAHFGGRCDRVEDPAVRQAGLCVVADQLVAVGSDPNSGILWSLFHRVIQLIIAAVIGRRRYSCPTDIVA